MSKKMMMLALAAVSAALFAMPAVASAGEWDLHNAPGQKFTVTKVTNAVLEASNTDVVTCTGLTGSGEYTTTKTGNITLDFTGCKENTFGTECQSGATSGTISVTNKQFHNVIIGNSGDKFTPLGVLITGASGGTTDFTTFTCAFGLLSITVTGNVIGEVEPVECNKPATTFNLKFEPKSAVGADTYTQKYEQITTTGENYDLISHIPATNGQPFTSSQTGTGQIHFPNAVTPTCT
jgi:hypothetical protein